MLKEIENCMCKYNVKTELQERETMEDVQCMISTKEH